MSRQKPDAFRTADDVAEGVRKLNHATLNHQYSAPEISSIVGGLLTASERLPQLIEQLCTQLAKRAAEGQVRMENGRDPASYVEDVVWNLAQARVNVEHLRGSLQGARSVLYNMGAPFSEDDDEETAGQHVN